MGQAKLRGSLEQRKAEGIARRQMLEANRRKEAAVREAALTPQQRAKRKETVVLLNTMVGVAASLGLRAAIAPF